MKFNGVIFRKIEVIEETLRKLRELGDITTETLSNDFDRFISEVRNYAQNKS